MTRDERIVLLDLSSRLLRFQSELRALQIEASRVNGEIGRLLGDDIVSRQKQRRWRFW